MSEANESKIDLVERAVAEATGSKAVGAFTRVAFEAAMNLRAGLSREQTGNAMQSYQRAGRPDPDDPSRMLPDEYELEIIEKIQAFRQEGLSLRKISDRLGNEGYKPRKVDRMFKGRTVQVKGKWHHGLIRSILKRAETEKKNEME